MRRCLVGLMFLRKTRFPQRANTLLQMQIIINNIIDKLSRVP
ncbi:hypothetical protein BN137_4302 [Cronobacter condimenti 1330]|uniref:Uncharacterized protein n=1 Tax=Cronobacter condimenti 1330 TaxID=1073999 RepID=K8A492_9ENTR|nr:hypothetical protein BN137_4302 [Cronobacter condimenti 1330]